MKNTFVNIAGKLPPGLTALYGDISDVATTLDIDLLIVGAIMDADIDSSPHLVDAALFALEDPSVTGHREHG